MKTSKRAIIGGILIALLVIAAITLANVLPKLLMH